MSIIKSKSETTKRSNPFDSLRRAAKNVVPYGGKLDILADVSYSMDVSCKSGKPAVKEVESAARDVVSKYINRVDIDLILFGGSSAKRMPGAAIPSLYANGGTPMTEAIVELMIDPPGTQAILMSDGEPNDEESVRASVNQCIGRHIIHTLAIGPHANHKLLRWIAEVTGGVYYTIDDAIELPVAMMALASHAVAALIGGDEDVPNLPKRT